MIFTAEGFSLVQEVDRLEFLVQPHDAKKKETISFRVALVDVDGNVVPLSGVFIYLDLFVEGSEVPNNQSVQGEHFDNTEEALPTSVCSSRRRGVTAWRPGPMICLSSARTGPSRISSARCSGSSRCRRWGPNNSLELLAGLTG